MSLSLSLSLSAAVSTRPIIIHLRNAIWALELLPNIEKEDQMHQWENTANDPSCGPQAHGCFPDRLSEAAAPEHPDLTQTPSEFLGQVIHKDKFLQRLWSWGSSNFKGPYLRVLPCRLWPCRMGLGVPSRVQRNFPFFSPSFVTTLANSLEKKIVG